MSFAGLGGKGHWSVTAASSTRGAKLALLQPARTASKAPANTRENAGATVEAAEKAGRVGFIAFSLEQVAAQAQVVETTGASAGSDTGALDIGVVDRGAG